MGMGQELAVSFAEAKAVFQEVDDALEQNLSKLIWHGEPEELSLTQNTQPALMAVSVAVARVVEKQAGASLADMGHFIAGHSLGEYSALTAAKSLSLSDAARVLRIRGLAMQEAIPAGQGAMAALLGLDITTVKDLLGTAPSACEVANDNAPGQVVISGLRGAVDIAINKAKDAGAKRAILLNVSAPFHCALMAPAADSIQEAFAGITVHAPTLPLVANVTAKPVEDTQEIGEGLVRQVTGTVRWRESMAYMHAVGGCDCFVEMGAGRVLGGLAKRCCPEASCVSIHTPKQVEDFLETL